MKQLLLIACCSSPLFFLAGCSKEKNRQFRVSFYASEQGRPMTLYVDGQDRGQLPYFAAEPGCESSGADVLMPLVATLPSGEHSIVGMDAQGTVQVQGTLRLTESTTGSSGNAGGIRLSRSGDCVLVGMWY